MGLFSKLFKKHNDDAPVQGVVTPADPAAPAPTDQVASSDAPEVQPPLETPEPSPAPEQPTTPPVTPAETPTTEGQSNDPQNPANPA